MAAPKTAAVTVGTTAVELTSPGEDWADNVGGSAIAVDNIDGTATVYLGGPDVTAANGFPVRAGSTWSGDLDQGEPVYAVVASGTQTVRVIKLGVGS